LKQILYDQIEFMGEYSDLAGEINNDGCDGDGGNPQEYHDETIQFKPLPKQPIG
jgi:hypothetical protein